MTVTLSNYLCSLIFGDEQYTKVGMGNKPKVEGQMFRDFVVF